MYKVGPLDLDLARAQLVASLSREITDHRVLSIIGSIPRELFIPSNSRDFAYDDRPLGIGFGQTISQPLIVAMMTEALELRNTDKILEVGTGSGYQTAILANLAGRVVSVERVPQLAKSAKDVLDIMGYDNVEIHVSEHSLGWPDQAPYNCIIVTAGAPRIPSSLLKQLVVGGKLVIPVGSRWSQELFKVTKGEKQNRVENLGGCRFVPLIGDDAWDSEE
jgi:protein-L-isoaspartate(D-aspartate) O-methyltransferase